MKEHLPFCSELSILCIEELLLTVLSNFERQAPLKDSALWWIVCLTPKVLRPVYSLMVNLFGWVWHMVCYIQYLWWRVVEGVGQNRETDKVHDENCVEEGFQLDSITFGRDGERVLSTENCSINIWDRSELELALCKESSSCFENNSQYFYYLVFQIHRCLRSVVFYID